MPICKCQLEAEFYNVLAVLSKKESAFKSGINRILEDDNELTKMDVEVLRPPLKALYDALSERNARDCADGPKNQQTHKPSAISRHLYDRLLPGVVASNPSDICIAELEQKRKAIAARCSKTSDTSQTQEIRDRGIWRELFLLAYRPVAKMERQQWLELTKDVRSSFAVPFHGVADVLLQSYIRQANAYINANRGSVYAKTFPILQSSGTGKTKLAVQLSALQAGFLLCTRDPNHQDKASFPPCDKDVYDFLRQSETDSFSAHKRVACWFAAYFERLAKALKDRLIMSKCFEQEGNTFVPKHNEGVECWQSIVHHLATAIHAGPDFIEEYNFRGKVSHQPPSCTLSELETVEFDDSFESAEAYRTDLLEEINVLAAKKFRTVDQKPVAKPRGKGEKKETPTPTEAQIANDVAQKCIKKSLEDLEDLLPTTLQPTHFFFLIIDEALALAHTLPNMRRLWREMKPRHTWLLFIDTHSKVAQLAGVKVRLASARLEASATMLVIPPFVQLPFNVAFKDIVNAEFKQDVLHGRKTFQDQLSTLSAFGRPLWNTNLYRFDDDQSRPKCENILLKLLVGTCWPNLWPNNIDDAVDQAQSAPFQAIMATAGQRLPLHFRGYRGVDSPSPTSSGSTTAQDIVTRSTGFLQEQASSYLRVISRVHDNFNFVTCNVSEPALSLAVAYMLRSHDVWTTSHTEAPDCATKWSQILMVLVAAHKLVGLMLGEEGEEGLRLLCHFAADLVAEKRVEGLEDPSQVFSATCDPISLQDWLIELLGEDRLEPGLKTWAAGRYINFTHFCRLEALVYTEYGFQRRLDRMTLAEYWWRQGAIYGQQTPPGWDLLIPIYENKPGPPKPEDEFVPGKLSYVAIQVKNSSKSTMKATRFFGPSFAEDTTDCSRQGAGLRHGNDCLEIFMDLRSPEHAGKHRFEKLKAMKHEGSEDNETLRPPLNRYHLVVSGCSKAVFPLLSKLRKKAQAGFPFLLGNPDPEDPRQALLTSLTSGHSGFRSAERLLDGDTPRFLSDLKRNAPCKRQRRKVPWDKLYDAKNETDLGDTDDEGGVEAAEVVSSCCQCHIANS